MDKEGEKRQFERLSKLRKERDNELCSMKLEALRQAARGNDNLMPYIMEAVAAYATLGEVCDVLRNVLGEYRLPALV